jgi:molecular chaperone DnaJ
MDMAEKRDCYEILGVSKRATKDEIKSAYRKLAKKFHPDNKESGDETKFKEVQMAYDILYDDQKRSTYDQFGYAAFEQPGGGGNPGGANPFGGGFGGEGFDFGDIFNSFFGGGSRRQANPTAPRRGNDVVMRVKVDFMDAVLGRDITIPMNIDETCSACHGSGARTPHDVKTCPTCNGRGYVRMQRRSLFGTMESEEACPNCGGSGKIITDKCPSCSGKGYNRKKKDVTVHILAGINEGQQIRVNGLGERGANGGPNGDLYVEVVIKPHPNFTREGNDIHINVPLDFVDAVLGTDIDVPAVYGEVTLNIPAGTQPGQILRMKGQGIKDLRSGKPGNQYVHLIVKVPTSLSKEQKNILESFRAASNPKESFFTKFKKTFKI